MNKPVPLHMRLFNAAFRLPFLPFKVKEKLAYSFLPAEKAKEFKKDFHSMAGSFNSQFGTYEALMEFAPNYARWNTPEELAKIEGGKLVASAAGASICDFWTPKEVDFFFAKYINSTEDHLGFCKTMFRIAYSLGEWGFVNGDLKNPIKLTPEQQAEMRETVWGGMSHYLSEEMPEAQMPEQWMYALKPLFYPNEEGN